MNRPVSAVLSKITLSAFQHLVYTCIILGSTIAGRLLSTSIHKDHSKENNKHPGTTYLDASLGLTRFNKPLPAPMSLRSMLDRSRDALYALAALNPASVERVEDAGTGMHGDQQLYGPVVGGMGGFLGGNDLRNVLFWAAIAMVLLLLGKCPRHFERADGQYEVRN